MYGSMASVASDSNKLLDVFDGKRCCSSCMSVKSFYLSQTCRHTEVEENTGGNDLLDTTVGGLLLGLTMANLLAISCLVSSFKRLIAG